jgi:branched-chain amino acid transport system substrate-binding protein
LDQSGNETIKIGAIYNLDGSEATFDIPSSQGARLAIEEINEQGGINGKALELVLANGKSNTSTIIESAQELARSGTIHVIIGLSNPDHALPAAQEAAKEKVYFVTSGATSPHLPEQVPGYLYLACMGDNTQAAVGAEYAVGQLGAKHVFILYQADRSYPTLLAEYFKRQFEELNGTVENVATFNSTDPISTKIANISSGSAQPDLLFLSTETWADAEPIIKEIRKAGLSMPILGGDGYDSPTLLTGGAIGIDGVYYTTHTYFDPKTMDTNRSDFVSRYEQEYNSSAVPFAGLGFDTVKIVAKAIMISGSQENFQEGMANISSFKGVTGNLSYSGGVHIPVKTVTLMKIQNGKLVHIGDFMPDQVPSP